MKRRIENIHTGGNGEENPGYKYGRIDSGLMIVVFLMICFGTVMLFSASMTEGFASHGDSTFFVSRQLLFTVVGIGAALLIAFFMPAKFFDRIWITATVYVATTILLFLLFIPENPVLYGVEINGARRWLSVLGFRMQPAEAAKISLVFCLAGYSSWIRRKIKRKEREFSGGFSLSFYSGFFEIVVPVIAISIWMIQVLFQPHVSWIVITSILSIFIFINAGIPFKSWVSGIIILVVIGVVVFMVFSIAAPLLSDNIDGYVNFDYVNTRLAIFMSPDSLTPDELYQSEQSINAIGSGGVFGVGIGNSIQKWGYLPMQYNDYVFSIIAEELGFIGAFAVLLLFLVYFFLGIKVAMKSSGTFYSLIAFGITGVITIQALLNIAVALNIIPPTGISLPFFSYGGSSAVMLLVGVGLLLNVSKFGTSKTPSKR